MEGNHLKWFVSLLIFAFLSTSCAGTKITQQYVDDTYTGTLSKFLVIGLIGSPVHQQEFEQQFVAQLKSIGVDAVSSRKVMALPSDLVLTKEMVEKAVQKYKNDAVIITQLADIEDETEYHGGSDNLGFWDYYAIGYNYLFYAGSDATSTTDVRLETKLFDVRTEKLIWSGTTETIGPLPESGEIMPDVITALVDKLEKSRLISH